MAAHRACYIVTSGGEMRRLEVTKFAAIIFLATVIAIVSARPQAAQVVGNYFHGLARPSVSDRDRFYS